MLTSYHKFSVSKYSNTHSSGDGLLQLIRRYRRDCRASPAAVGNPIEGVLSGVQAIAAEATPEKWKSRNDRFFRQGG